MRFSYSAQALFMAMCLCGLSIGGEADNPVPDPNAVKAPEKPKGAKELVLFADMPLVIESVYGASKHDQKITEAPSSVSVVTKEDIKQFGFRTLADILNSIRGVYVTSDRGYEHIGIRGINRPGDYGGRILVNINGHRLNDPIYDSALAGREFPLDVDLIERVEVIRGPGSALYGNNAFCAIVNVVTRQGRDIGGNGLEVSGSYGSDNAYSGRFSFGRKFSNGIETLVSGTWYNTDGEQSLYFPEFRDTHGGTVREFDGQRSRDVFASISYAGLTLEGLYGRRDKEIPTAAYFTVFNDKRTQLWDERAYAELRYEHEFDSGWQMLSRTYYDRYSYTGTFPYETEAAVIAVNKDKPHAGMVGTDFQISKTLASKHHLTLGAEGRYDFDVTQFNYDINPPVTNVDQHTTPYSFGMYVQDEYAILDKLTLDVGLRFDHFSTFGDTLNPRAAVIYHPRKSSTFKALYGQAYRAPNAYEIDYHDVSYAANTNLKPETTRSYELVWEEFLGKRYRVTGSLFYNQIDSFITQGEEIVSGVSQQVFRNSQSADVYGGEAELGVNWGHGLRGSLSYTFSHATDNGDGRTLTNSPKHVGKSQLAIPMYKEKVFAGLELQALSSRRNVQGGTTPAYAMANLTVFGKEIVKNLEFSAGIYNVFDKKYYDPAGPDFVQSRIPQEGRTFRLKMTFKW